MSFSWDAVDQRTRQKMENDRALKDFLLLQQAETKSRKLAEKQNDIAEYQRNIVGPSITVGTRNGVNQQQQQRRSTTNDLRLLYTPSPFQQLQALPPAAGPRLNNPLQTGSADKEQATSILGPKNVSPNDYSYTGSHDGDYTKRSRRHSDTYDTLSHYHHHHEPPFENTDISGQLRVTIDQLHNERRARTWLETEVQSGKAQLAQLSARVEKLSEIIAHERTTTTEAARAADQAEHRASAAAQELTARFERAQAKIHSLVAEMATRQKSLEYHDSEESERHRVLADEVNTLRYKLESFGLATAEVGNEVRAKARDLEYEQQRGADTMRVIKDHDHALETLHHTIDASSDSLSKKFEITLVEIRQRVDSEARGRFQFESGMRELYADMRKVLSTQERETTDRIESARQQASVAFDRERLERERNIGLVMDEVRNSEKIVKDALTLATDKMSSQIMSIDDVVGQERVLRVKFENQVKLNIEEGFKLIQTTVMKRFEEMQLIQADLRHSVGSAVKALKESVTLVERTNDQKIGAIEEVLKAEIRSRMETDRQVSETKKEMEVVSTAIEKRAMAAIVQAIEESRENNSKLQDDLKKTAEQLISAKTRSIDDLENQVELLRKRLIESDTETTAKIRLAHLSAEQVGRTAQASLDVVELRMEAKFSAEQKNFDEVTEKLKVVAEHSGKIKIEIEEKTNFRSLQVESAMAAFKEELEMRLSKTDAVDLETKLVASIASVKSSIGLVHQTIQILRDEIEQRASKRDLDDSETRFKINLTSLGSRISEIDENFFEIKDEISSKTSRKEFEDHNSNLKSVILNLELKEVGFDELLDKIQNELSEKASKKNIEDQDDRFKNFIMEQESNSMNLEENFRSLKDLVGLRATKLEIEDLEKKLSEQIFSIQDRVGEVSASVSEAKTEISQTMHDDVEEMVASINSALDSVQARTDKIDNCVEGMKLRISEAENSSRSRIQMFTNTIETLISESSITGGKAKEIMAQQIKELAQKIDNLPKQISEYEFQSEEFKKRIVDLANSEEDRINILFAEIRENLAAKVNETTLEKVQSDLTKGLQKLIAQQEIETMNVEQVKIKVNDLETFNREKMREFKMTLEKNTDDQASAIRSWRDSYGKRFEELDARTGSIPKILDQTWGEIRKIKFDIDERLRNDLSHLEKELNVTRSELASKVSNRSLDAAVSISVGPFNSRLDRLNRDIDELRSMTARLQGDVNGKICSGYSDFLSSSNTGVVNVHKPVTFAPIRETKINSDPKLERIADMAEANKITESEEAKELAFSISGSSSKDFEAALNKVAALHNKHGPFELMLSTGDFFAAPAADSMLAAKLLSNSIIVPAPLYVVAGRTPPPTRIAERVATTGEICANVYFLGDNGVFATTEGLRIAYLSGILASTSQQPPKNPPDVQVYTRNTAFNMAAALPPAPHIDILITNDFPKDISRLSPLAEESSSWLNAGSEPIANLAFNLRPRYHFASSVAVLGVEKSNVFFEREPYSNPLKDNEPGAIVSRFIGLASFPENGVKSKERWFYAFNIVPMSKLDSGLLYNIPENTTSSPYTSPSQTPPAGYVCHACKDPGHWIANCPKRNTNARNSTRDPSQCWFCLSSPSIEKHLLVTIKEESYIACSKGGLSEWGGHLLIVPIGHIGSRHDISNDDALNTEIQECKDLIKTRFKEKTGDLPVFFEVYAGGQPGESGKKVQHMHIQVVPIPATLVENVRKIFLNAAALESLTEITGATLPNDPTLPYLRIEIPDGEDALVLTASANGASHPFFNQQFAR
ncbi:hypothetical protein HK100_010190, partial [Physocladia obscura]